MLKNIGVFLTIAVLALSVLLVAPQQFAGASEIVNNTENTEEESFWPGRGSRCPVGEERFAGELDEEEYEEWAQEREEFRRERQEAKIDRVEELIQEGEISKEEGEEIIEAIEERESFERGVCPVDGPRNHELNLNFREKFGEGENENTRGRGGFGNGGRGGHHGRHHNGSFIN